jgi:hypothetical protein
LQAFLDRHGEHPLAAAVRYALAVRFAREHRYDLALQLTENLALDAVLDRYPLLDGGYWLDDWDPVPASRTPLQPKIQAQRERWRQLSRWQAQSTPQQRLLVAGSPLPGAVQGHLCGAASPPLAASRLSSSYLSPRNRPVPLAGAAGADPLFGFGCPCLFSVAAGTPRGIPVFPRTGHISKLVVGAVAGASPQAAPPACPVPSSPTRPCWWGRVLRDPRAPADGR